MLSAEELEAAAISLEMADANKQPIRHLSLQHPGMTIEDAYAVQGILISRKLAAGRKIIGHKIGLTSRAMQQVSGIEEPDYGVLLDDMLYEDGDRIPFSRFQAPRVEVELAFRLAADLTGHDCTLHDVLAATDAVIPAFEILDARMHIQDPETGGRRKIVDTISDNAANAALVLGSRFFAPSELNLQWVSALCYRNTQIEESGVAAAVLGHPARGIVWLARKLAAHGIGLQAGQIILSGSFIRPVSARLGDVFRADFNELGSVTCQFC